MPTEAVFGREYNEALVHQIMVTPRLMRVLVRILQLQPVKLCVDSTKKPWRQKGIGRAHLLV